MQKNNHNRNEIACPRQRVEYGHFFIFLFFFMQKDCCSNRWFCPSIIGVTAGLIMIAAGATKFLAGKAMLTGVGGMALGVFGVAQGEMANVALTLGIIAATIELL